MSRVLRALGVGVLALFVIAVGGTIWLFSADLGFLQPRIERLVATQTGRSFTAGSLSIRLGRSAVLRATDLRLGNPDWASEPSLAEIGTVMVALDLVSLLGDAPVVEQLVLEDVVLAPEIAADGARSWNLETGPAPKAEKTSNDRPLAFRLLELDLRRLHGALRSPERRAPLEVEITAATQRLDDDGMLALAIDGMVGASHRVSVVGHAGSWGAILAGRDVVFDMEARLGAIEAELRGRIDDLAMPRRPALSFALRSPSFDELARLLALEERETGSVDLVGSLGAAAPGGEAEGAAVGVGAGAAAPLVLAVVGQIGQATIDAKGSVSDLQDLDEAELDLTASGPDLGRILLLAGIPGVDRAPFEVELSARRDRAGLRVPAGLLRFGEATIAFSGQAPGFPVLTGAEAELQARGDALQKLGRLLDLPPELSGPFALDAAIAALPDAPERLALELTTTLGRVAFDGELGRGKDYSGTAGRVELAIEDLARLGPLLDLTVLPSLPLASSGRLTYDGGRLQIAEPWPLRLGSVEGSLAGDVSLAAGGAAFDLDLSARGPSLQPLTDPLALPIALPDLPFDVSGRIALDDGTLTFAAPEARFGSTGGEIAGVLRPERRAVDRQAGRRGDPGQILELTVDLRGDAIEELTSAIHGLSLEPGPFAAGGRITLAGNNLRLEDLRLDRPGGELSGRYAVSGPPDRREQRFEIAGAGRDIHDLVQVLGPVALDPGPFSLALRGSQLGRVWNFQKLEFELAAARLAGRGRFELGADAAPRAGGVSTRLELEISIPDLSLLALTDGREFRPRSFSLAATVAGTRALLQVDDLAVRLGPSDLTGALSWRPATGGSGAVPRLDARLSSRRLDLSSPLMPRSTEERAEALREAAADGLLIPNSTLPFELFDRLDGELRLEADTVVAEGRELGALVLALALGDGAAAVEEFRIAGPSGAIAMAARSSPAPGGRNHRLEIRARELGFPVGDWNLDGATRMDLDLVLATRGRTLRELLQRGDGAMVLYARGGVVPDSPLLQTYYGGFLEQAFKRLNPFYSAPKRASLECVIVPLALGGGVLRSAPSSLYGTARMRLSSDSELQLATEALEMVIRSTPRRSLSVSAAELFNPFTKITGTLAAPRMAVDQSSALVTGGAAIATAGLSLVAKAAWDRVSRSGDPCGEALRLGRETLSEALNGELAVTIEESAAVPAAGNR